jgi:hypothetical protein
MLFLELEAEMGAEEAGQVSLEVSSPGADRTLRMPQDLARFGALPLKVEHTGADGAAVTQVCGARGAGAGCCVRVQVVRCRWCGAAAQCAGRGEGWQGYTPQHTLRPVITAPPGPAAP